MPRDGAIIFGDLIGKLDALNVHCPKCSRAGRYRVPLLIDDRSPQCQGRGLAHRRLPEGH